MTDDQETPKEVVKAYRYDGSIDLNFLGRNFSVAKSVLEDGIMVLEIDVNKRRSWNVQEGDIMVRAGDEEFYLIRKERVENL